MSKYDKRQQAGYDQCVLEVPKILNAYFKRNDSEHDENAFLADIKKAIMNI